MKIDGNDITMIRGDSKDLYIRCYDGGSHIPFEKGDTVYFTVKESPSKKEKILQKIVKDFQDGVAHIEIMPGDTKQMKFKRKYVYDVQVTFKSGRVNTIVPLSHFMVTEEVTHE